MPTIIDSLVVAFGLDDSGYKKGTERVTKAQEETQRKIKKSSESISKSLWDVTKTVGALFLGFESASGLISFLGRINSAQASLSRMSLNLGMSARSLDIWDKKIELAGGSVAGAQSAIQQLNQDINGILTMGQGSGLTDFLQRMGVALFELSTDGSRHARRATTIYEDLFATLGKLPRDRAFQIATQAGVSNDVLQYGLRPENERAGDTAEAERLTRTTDANAKAADELRKRWVAVHESIDGIGVTFLEKITPSLEKMLPLVEDIAVEFGNWIASFKQSDVDDFFKGAIADLTEFTDDFKWLIGELKTLKEKGVTGVIKDMASDAWANNKDKILNWRMVSPIAVDAVQQYSRWWEQFKGYSLDKTNAVRAAPYMAAFTNAEDFYGLPKGTMASIAYKESRFNPNVADSSAGARGMMQLMPKYFPDAGKNPTRDIQMAAAYLAKLRDQFGGNMDTAVAAYNAGPGTINDVLAGKRELPQETKGYLETFGDGVLASVRYANDAYKREAAARDDKGNLVQIDNVNIHTKATDGAQVAVDFMAEMKRRQLLVQADSGISQ